MSNSSLISYTQISPSRNSPRNQPIRKITIHHMADFLSLEQFGALVAKESRQMSANYAVDKEGGIGLYCPESDRSWCSSSPWNDHQAVITSGEGNVSWLAGGLDVRGQHGVQAYYCSIGRLQITELGVNGGAIQKVYWKWDGNLRAYVLSTSQ